MNGRALDKVEQRHSDDYGNRTSSRCHPTPTARNRCITPSAAASPKAEPPESTIASILSTAASSDNTPNSRVAAPHLESHPIQPFLSVLLSLCSRSCPLHLSHVQFVFPSELTSTRMLLRLGGATTWGQTQVLYQALILYRYL